MNLAEAKPQDDALELGAFVRTLTHEIANPLNAVVMNAELAKLLLDRNQPDHARHALEQLLVDCGRCGRLLDGLRRFGAGLQQHAREKVSAVALVDAAVETARQDRPGLPAVQVNAAALRVDVDQLTLQRVLVGLLQNAADAGASRVLVAIRADGDAAVIELADDGAGLPAEGMLAAVEPFVSSHRARGASGLGLTLAREVLRRHDGELRIDANSERGTRVCLRLPRVHDEAETVPA